MKKVTQNDERLRAAFASAVYSIDMLLISALELSAYRDLKSCLTKGLGVDLIILKSQLERLGLTNHFLNNFREAGGRIFLLEAGNVNWREKKINYGNSWQVDSRTKRSSFSYLKRTSILLPLTKNNDPLIGKVSNDLTENKWGEAADIHFNCSTEVVCSGDTVVLHWSAPKADFVSIEPSLGKLPPIGSRPVNINRTTEFVLTAYQQRKSISKVKLVTLAVQPSLRFYLTKITDQGEVMLKNHPDLAHHFGVMSGESVVLHWETFNAEEITIYLGESQLSPDKKLDACGNMELAIVGRQEVLIKVIGQMKTIEQRLVIKSFSIPEPGLPAIAPNTELNKLLTSTNKWLK